MTIDARLPWTNEVCVALGVATEIAHQRFSHNSLASSDRQGQGLPQIITMDIVALVNGMTPICSTQAFQTVPPAGPLKCTIVLPARHRRPHGKFRHKNVQTYLGPKGDALARISEKMPEVRLSLTREVTGR